MKLGLFAGSVGAGLGDASGETLMETVWGRPSAALARHEVAGGEVLVLPRHGVGHEFAPHEINYRANVQAFKDASVDAVIGLFTVGSIDPALPSGAIVVPDQVIDYTWGREQTFGGHRNGAPVHHVLFDPPYDDALRAGLVGAGADVVDGGVYGCTQGPRLETAAEIRRMARDGCTLVGMTGMPKPLLRRSSSCPTRRCAWWSIRRRASVRSCRRKCVESPRRAPGAWPRSYAALSKPANAAPLPQPPPLRLQTVPRPAPLVSPPAE